MSSLFDDLSTRLAQDPRLTKRGGPRVDLSVMLFNARDQIRELWIAAEEQAGEDADGAARLRAAVDELRPIFGGRSA